MCYDYDETIGKVTCFILYSTSAVSLWFVELAGTTTSTTISYLTTSSKTRMCARLEIRTGRLWPRSHTYVASHRARAVRAKCRLAGLTKAWAMNH